MTKLENYLPLDGLGGTYSEEQARQAIANAEAAAKLNLGSGGSSGSDASATNQSAQIALETAIRNRLSGSDSDVIFAKLNELLTELQQKTEPSNTQQISGAIAQSGTWNINNISGAISLPTGAATDTTLQQVRDAIKAQIDIASTLWTDNSGTFYVRRDLVNEGTGVITVVFALPDGTTATPGAGLRPLSTIDKDVLCDYYDVVTSSTGYNIGDLLARIAIIDANGATPLSTFIWMNLTAGTILGTNPTLAHIERANETTNVKQSGTWTVAVNNFPSTQTVSGNVGISSLPALPTGSNIIGAISNTGFNVTGSLPGFASTPAVNTGLSQPLTDTQLRASNVSTVVNNFPSTFAATQSGTWNINNISGAISLPTNAATSILQTTGNTSLGSIDTKIPNLGQAISASSVPVVLPASQVTALTPPASVGITGTLPGFTSTPTVNIGNLPSMSTSNRTVTGSLATGTNTLAINTGDLAGVGVSITGTWVGTVTFQGTVDGTNWINVYGYTLPDAAFSFATTANGQFSVNAAGFAQVRVSAIITSGTATIGMLATKETPIITSQIRNTSLQLTNNDSNPLSIKLGNGVLVDVGLRTGTNNIGNVGIANPLPTESIIFSMIGINLSSGHVADTWYDSTFGYDLTTITKGYKSIEFYPEIKTAAINAGCIMVIRFYSTSTGASFAGSNMGVRYDFDTLKGTPDAEGNSIQTNIIRNYAFPISTIGHLKTNTMICEIKNGNTLRLQAKVLSLAGNTASVHFNAFFKY